MRAITPRYLFGGSGIEVRGVLLRPGATVQLPGSPNDGRHLPHPYPTIWSHLRGIFNIQMTKWGRRVELGGGIAVDVLSRNVCAWIPAFAGMTNGAVGTTKARRLVQSRMLCQQAVEYLKPCLLSRGRCHILHNVTFLLAS